MPRSIEASAFVSLLVFLGINYLCGYQFGMLVTGSRAFAVPLALAMPLVSLVALALVRAKAEEPPSLPER